jgi:hypothetical protein
MVRFRILVLLLVIAALATGRQFGPAPQYNAFLTLVPMLVLGYFVTRPERYNPDVPFYQPGGLERARKWARWTTLAGLVLFLVGSLVATRLFVAMDSNPTSPTGPDPLAIAGSSAGTIGMGLLCIGFVAWSAAVFLKKK